MANIRCNNLMQFLFQDIKYIIIIIMLCKDTPKSIGCILYIFTIDFYNVSNVGVLYINRRLYIKIIRYLR